MQSLVKLMMKKFVFVVIVFMSLFILIYTANFYFLSRLNYVNNSSKYKIPGDTQISNDNFKDSFLSVDLKPIYRSRNPKFNLTRTKLLANFESCENDENYSVIWNEVNSVSIKNASKIDNI